MLSPKSLVKTILFATAIALTVSACNQNGEEREITYTPDKIYKLTILYTSGFSDSSTSFSSQTLRDAKAELISSIRDEAENDQSHLILISGGTESPESPESPAVFTSYLDELSYDALVVNSYMFNQPLTHIRELEKGSSTPFISANLFASETGQPLFDGFTLISADDLNIAVVGITSDEIREEHRKHLSGLDIISSPNSKSTNFIEKLKGQSDIVIAATHSGHFSGATLQQQIASYPGIDLVVGEHQNVQDDASLSAHNCHEWMTRINLEFLNGKIKETLREKLIVAAHKTSASNI